MYGGLLWSRSINSTWVLFFQRTKMVVSVRAISYTLLDKCRIVRGLMYPVQLFGVKFEFCQQGLALLALIPHLVISWTSGISQQVVPV